jgi:cytochrome c
LTSYLWAQQFFLDSGDVEAGKRVFAAKRCAPCHEDVSSGAPQLGGVRQAPLTGPGMVSVLWRHGPQMMEQMKDKGIPWPRFAGAEMANLIAYLNSRRGGKQCLRTAVSVDFCMVGHSTNEKAADRSHEGN